MPISRRRKPILVGESNPYGGDPHFALYPAPDGCSGERLCHLVLGMRRTEYLRVFDRTNLCAGGWSGPEATRRAVEILDGRDRVILLGSKVCRAFGWPLVPFTVVDGGRLLRLPHPSGLCRLWNEDRAFQRARVAVAEFVPEVAHLLGVVE